jgi:prepilin-type N-terminal cleavage/methylation domain-containing protein
LIIDSRRRQKIKHNGFSLIELVVAIAILVVLIGLLAPQFMRYLDRTRKARDISNADAMMQTIQVISMEELVANKTHDRKNKELPSVHYEAVTNYLPEVASDSSTSAKDRIQEIYTALSGTDPVCNYAFICLIEDNIIVKARYKNMDTKKIYCWEEGSEWREYTAADFENDRKTYKYKDISNWGSALAAGVPGLNSLAIWWNGLDPTKYSSQMKSINEVPSK